MGFAVSVHEASGLGMSVDLSDSLGSPALVIAEIGEGKVFHEGGVGDVPHKLSKLGCGKGSSGFRLYEPTMLQRGRAPAFRRVWGAVTVSTGFILVEDSFALVKVDFVFGVGFAGFEFGFAMGHAPASGRLLVEALLVLPSDIPAAVIEECSIHIRCFRFGFVWRVWR